MLTRRRMLQYCLAALPASLLAAPGASRTGPALQAWGYYPTWLTDAWRHINLAPWNRIILFHVPAMADGSLSLPADWSTVWQPLAATVDARGGQFDVAVTVLDEAHFATLFNNSAAGERMIAGLLRITELPGVRGLHLDVEVYRSAPSSLLAQYRAWVAELTKRLASRSTRTQITAFVPMGGEVALYDPPTLRLFDHLVVQGYDAHPRGSSIAGPVAPLRGPHALSWENSLAQMLAWGVPRTKMLFSLPYFGYEWPAESDAPGARTLGAGIEITYAPVDPERLPLVRVNAMERVRAHGLRRDPQSGSPYYVFRDGDDQWRQGWFEDAVSLAEKMGFLEREGLAGAAAFPVGYDAGAFDGLIGRGRGAGFTSSRPTQT